MRRYTICRSRVADYQALRAFLSSRPHPNAYRADKGDTRLDWAEWMLANAGTSGLLDVCAYVDKAIKLIEADR